MYSCLWEWKWKPENISQQEVEVLKLLPLRSWTPFYNLSYYYNLDLDTDRKRTSYWAINLRNLKSQSVWCHKQSGHKPWPLSFSTHLFFSCFLLGFVACYFFYLKQKRYKKNSKIELISKSNTYDLVGLYNVLTSCAIIY